MHYTLLGQILIGLGIFIGVPAIIGLGALAKDKIEDATGWDVGNITLGCILFLLWGLIVALITAVITAAL